MAPTPEEITATYASQNQVSSALTDVMGLVSVKSFKAKGDNINNDTQAIKDCADYADAHGLKSIFFPHGTYKVDAGLGNYLSGFFLWGDNSTIVGDTIEISQIGTNTVSGIDKFLSLTDAPKSFTGYKGQALVVNDGESSLEFVKLNSVYYSKDQNDAFKNELAGAGRTTETIKGAYDGLNSHKDSSEAHSSDNIVYLGTVQGAGTVKEAIDTLKQENDNAVSALAGSGRTTETVKGAYDSLDTHVNTDQAHQSSKIAYSGTVTGSNVKSAIDNLKAYADSEKADSDSKIQSHKDSGEAHLASSIIYIGAIEGNNMKSAIDNLKAYADTQKNDSDSKMQSHKDSGAAHLASNIPYNGSAISGSNVKSAIDNLKSYTDAKKSDSDSKMQSHVLSITSHPASSITYNGRVGGNNINAAMDNLGDRIDNIIAYSGDSDIETVDARYSSVKDKTYGSLSARLDDTDTQLADIVSIANYPVIAPETDDTARVLRAIAAGTKVIKFDAQTYTVNLEMTRGNVIFQGAGMGKTIIKGATANTPVIKTKGYKYITFLDMDVRSPYDNNTCVIDCTDSRYLDFRNLNINQIDGGSGNYNYSSDGILFADSSDTWTGYNRISNIFVTRCKNGIKSTSAANTVLSIKDSTFSYCGYFGLDLANLSTFYGYNNDISSNGQLMPVGGENYTQYGGVKITTSYNVKFQNTYCENNPNCYTGIYSHNNFYVDSSSTMIDINGVRDMVGTYGSIYPPFMSNKACSITYMPQDDRLGSKKVRNLAVNGNFKYFLSDGTFPQVWNATSKTSATYTQETTDLPSGFETGLKIAQVTDAAITGSYVTIYDSGNLSKGIISDISKYAGQYLTLACWVKTTLANNLRIGFDTNTSGTGVYFSVGKTLTIPSVGEWSRVVVRYQIVGTESRIMLGFRQSTIGTTSIITGMACSLDYGVNSNEGQFITEDGGNILSQEFKIGGCRHGYGTAAPTSGTWGKGDIIWNTSPSEAGTAGSKYVVNGWICTVAGTPGTWLPMRVLTGN